MDGRARLVCGGARASLISGCNDHGSNTLQSRYTAVRGRSVALAAPLSPEDCSAQSMPDASPTKWHLAHTTWFFETFVLEAHEPGFVPFAPAFRVLFNSYYNGVGAKHPRPQRGLLTRPAAFFALCTMLTAAGLRHAGDPFGDRELPLLFASVFFLLVLAGAGRYSLDALIRRRRGGPRA